MAIHAHGHKAIIITMTFTAAVQVLARPRHAYDALCRRAACVTKLVAVASRQLKDAKAYRHYFDDFGGMLLQSPRCPYIYHGPASGRHIAIIAKATFIFMQASFTPRASSRAISQAAWLQAAARSPWGLPYHLLLRLMSHDFHF